MNVDVHLLASGASLYPYMYICIKCSHTASFHTPHCPVQSSLWVESSQIQCPCPHMSRPHSRPEERVLTTLLNCCSSLLYCPLFYVATLSPVCCLTFKWIYTGYSLPLHGLQNISPSGHSYHPRTEGLRVI